MKKIIYQLLAVMACSLSAYSQTGKYWSLHSNVGKIDIDKAVTRQSFPATFKLFDLDIGPLRQELFSVVDNQARHSTIVSLPNADGQIEQFEVLEASNFEPDLQERFPGIRAFSGKGITDKYAMLKLSISPQGIQTMVFRADKENEFIEAYSQDHGVYAVFRSHRTPGQLPWTCSTQDQQIVSDLNSQVSRTSGTLSSAGQLKTMRLAQSCNGEYANYFGAFSAADVALVLAAFNATLTRCNGCYEKDLALHLNLIATTTSVIYYNPATDPYTTLASWNLQLQKAVTANIGEANYDIGHMFGASGGGGNAGCIGCVCVSPPLNGSGVPTGNGKGSGITSPADGIPEGDNFDVDYVVHEVGHQLGGNHTFTFQSEGGALATSAQREVGSGITIMGYAGITSQDVAPHSLDIYHETTIAQIQANLAGKACPVTTNITANNATPVVAPVSNHTIPISTPFTLTGSATDANPGDVLTYCWEQNDASTSLTGNSSVASATKASGPNWLSFSPSTSPTRICPKLSTILAGLFVTPVIAGGDAAANIEALSSVGRTLNFRLTVRDNCPYSSTAPLKVGQTAFTDMTVTVNAASGPFGVSSPNSAVSWAGLSSQTITWTVNNTNVAPVSCANVNILLSTDGGSTWPVTLAANTANDGSEMVTIPNNATTTARVKVESAGNIFFDISNTNFTITAATTITVNVKLFLQGYYNAGSGIMQPVLNNESVPSSLATETDTIIVELHHQTTHALIDTKKVVLLTNGTASATFIQPAGSYFIAVRHRNTLQTWTTAPLACTSSTPLYNFTTAANKAFGDNQVQVAAGIWAFFTGDLNQDEFIDVSDYPFFDSDNLGGVSGVYASTDMNGDGFVDVSDYPVFDNNNLSGVSSIHP
ncbi:MAG: reprolysin-like metallopeptidase [Ferruginibacter sp.]